MVHRLALAAVLTVVAAIAVSVAAPQAQTQAQTQAQVQVQTQVQAMAVELIMVERQGCTYCLQWKKDVGAEEYAATAEGGFAPLRIIDMRDAPPDGVVFARPVVLTPTFVLVENGAEIDRIEGYPGEDFFWGLLGMKLRAKTAFTSGS